MTSSQFRERRVLKRLKDTMQSCNTNVQETSYCSEVRNKNTNDQIVKNLFFALFANIAFTKRQVPCFVSVVAL